MKAIHKIAVPIGLVALSFSLCAAQPRVIVDARLQLPMPPVVVVAPPPPPPFSGSIRIRGGQVWNDGGYVHPSPRYGHRHEARKWRKAVKHSRHHAHHHYKKHHYKKNRRH
ncbi:MAG TPA: hypothetical protein PKV73_02505 [Agriterribacter sp.]|nr:hypothetical protein [Agriterribacter sp.]